MSDPSARQMDLPLRRVPSIEALGFWFVYSCVAMRSQKEEASYLTKLCHFAPPPYRGGAKWQSFVKKISGITDSARFSDSVHTFSERPLHERLETSG